MIGWPRFGPVGVAAAFALVAVGLALYAAQAPAPRTNETNDVSAVSAAPVAGEWLSLVTKFASSSTNRVPTLFTGTQPQTTAGALAQEIVALEQSVLSGALRQSEVNDALAEIVKKHITPVKANDVYTTASLNIAPVTLEDYAGALSKAMSGTELIEEYELTTFARALKIDDHDGTPELQRSAAIYRAVEKRLIAQSVPETLAPAHLGLIKSVAFMAQSIELMGNWTGDQGEALIFIDAFLRADTQVENALDALGSAMIKYGKAS